MQFQAAIIGEDGMHKVGVGPNPTAAVTAAFRKICEGLTKPGLDPMQAKQAVIENVGRGTVLQLFHMARVDDEYLEEVQTLKEEVHDIKMLVRVDPTKETMYTVCGWVRQTF